jgi:hypothetical protein
MESKQCDYEIPNEYGEPTSKFFLFRWTRRNYQLEATYTNVRQSQKHVSKRNSQPITLHRTSPLRRDAPSQAVALKRH